MTVNRASLDQYLDGEMSPEQIALVDAEVRANPVAANLLERMRRERALRAAAMSTYMPKPVEVTSIMQGLQGAFDEAEERGVGPIAKIGPMRGWMVRTAAVAAMLVIAAGAFWVGRATSPSDNGAAVASVPYIVHVVSSDGAITTHEFASLPEAKMFAQTIADRADKAMTQDQVASADGPGVF